MLQLLQLIPCSCWMLNIKIHITWICLSGIWGSYGISHELTDCVVTMQLFSSWLLRNNTSSSAMPEGPCELVRGWQGMGHFEAVVHRKSALHYGYIAYLLPACMHTCVHAYNVNKCMVPAMATIIEVVNLRITKSSLMLQTVRKYY